MLHKCYVSVCYAWEGIFIITTFYPTNAAKKNYRMNKSINTDQVQKKSPLKNYHQDNISIILFDDIS